MVGKTKNLILAVTVLRCVTFAATIWEENFDAYADGTGVNSTGNIGDYPGSVSRWSLDVTGADLSATDDYLKTVNGAMEAQDTDGPTVLTTEIININGYSNVTINVDITESGDLEAGDYANVEYSIDSGGWTIVTNWSGLGDATHTLIGDLPDDNDWVSQTITQDSLSGATLQIRVTLENNAGTEQIQMDNITVAGTSVTPPVNSPPVLDSIGDQSITVSNTLSFTVSATDADNDLLTLSASNLPPGAVFNTVTNAGTVSNTFLWAVAAPTATYSTVFFVDDGTTNVSETITITVSEPPKLLISEIADPAGTGGGYYRFVELYNAGNAPIILESGSWFLCKQANGSDSWSDIALAGTIPSGKTFVIAYSVSSFQEAYGFAPDQADNNINGTGDDAYFLFSGGDHTTGTRVDIYGEIDTDGTGRIWEYTDSRVIRKSTISEPNPTWTEAEWIIFPESGVEAMNPGSNLNLPLFQGLGNQSAFENESLTFSVFAADEVDNDPVTITATNLPAGATFDGATFHWPVATPVGTYFVTFIASDKDGSTERTIDIIVQTKPKLFISEIADPAGTGGGEFRFVELYNAGSSTIDLDTDNWVLCRHNNGETWYEFELAGSVAPGETYLIAADRTSFIDAYGFPPDAADSVADGNGDDAYWLYSNGGRVDAYGEQDVDGTGTDWEYTDSRVLRKSSVTEPNSTFTLSEWTIIPDTDKDLMGPGTILNLPVFQGLENEFALLGKSHTFTVSATDPIDGDDVTITATNLPPGAAFDGTTFSWSVAAPLGTFTATFMATDKDGTTSKTIDITVIELPLLIISEVADPGGDGGDLYRFVELCNIGDEAIDLADDEWHLCKQVNGGDSWSDIPLEGIIEPSQTWVIGSEEFADAYGFAPDQSSSSINGNGDDAYVLFFGGDHEDGAVIDIYGQINVDGSDTDWDYEDSQAERNYEVTEPSADWTADEWTIQSGTIDRMNPGQYGPIPQITLPNNLFIFSGDSFDFSVSATTPIKTNDTITLWAPNLPDGAVFAQTTGIGTVARQFSWNQPADGTYPVTFSAIGQNGTGTRSTTLTVSDHSSLNEWFYRWKGKESIYELNNGQFWQQTSSETYGNYGLNEPDVYIEKRNSSYRMTIPNVLGSVTVRQLKNTVKTRISGTFNGCAEDNIYKLQNRTWWRQTSTETSSRSRYLLGVLLWQNSDESFEMQIEDEDAPITVEQLAVTESDVTGLFTSFSMGRDETYQLADGTVWKQSSSSDSTTTDDTDLTAWRWTEDGSTWMRFVDSSNREIGTCLVTPAGAPDEIVSRIDGFFRGWKGQRVFMLQNGEYWQQTTPVTVEQTLYEPKVILTDIDPSGTAVLRVDGALPPATVAIQQLIDVKRLSIDGWFHGFQRGNIFSLTDDTWLRQTSSEITTYSSHKPEILCYGGNRLEMPGLGLTIETEPLNVQAESIITNQFNGLAYGNTYALQNGTSWLQFGKTRTRTAIEQPAAMLWLENNSHWLLVRDDLDQTVGMCVVTPPDADDDGDQIANFAEVIAGTAINDATDRFLIQDIQQSAEGKAVLNWTSAESRSYAVEWTPSLNESFQTLETDIEWPENCWTNTSIGDGGFYRIRVQLKQND